MNDRYWLPPGTAATTSVNGGEFKPFNTNELMSFESPATASAEDFACTGDGWQVRVARALVYRYEWDRNGGTNRLCS
jgi:hypothetical protein